MTADDAPPEVIEQRRREWDEPVANYRAALKAELDAIPEPPELAEQAAAMAAQRARWDQRCAECGQTRHSHGWKANELTAGCRFVETES